jgi:hypothetical protein
LKIPMAQGFPRCGDFRAIASNAANTEHACAEQRLATPR